MNTKKCNTCGLDKFLSEMVKNKRVKCGYASICKKCNNDKLNNKPGEKEKRKIRSQKHRESNNDKNKEYQKKYREVNKEKNKKYQKEYSIIKDNVLKEYKKEWNEANPDYQKNYNKKYYLINSESIKRSAKNYRNNNKVKINKHNKDRKIHDPLFKMRHSIGNIILKAIKRKGYLKKSKTAQILGCTYEEFKNYLESKFESWMTWDNHGLYNGELNYGWDIDHIIPISTAMCEKELIDLNNYKNLQPLCSKVNRDIKKDNITF